MKRNRKEFLMINDIQKRVYELLSSDNSGHGIDHIERVVQMSLKFCEIEKANKEIVTLIALLHDVDDYKLFGLENARNLTNARRILEECFIDENTKNVVLSEVECIGYSKFLDGKRPATLEGKIVSDADMCDALGATGILRSYKYNIEHNCPFFDKNNFPIEKMVYEEYVNKTTGTVVNHMFEKILKLKALMLTVSGKKEAENRHNFVVQFLKQIFYEENVPEWNQYLEEYLIRCDKD